MDFKSVDPIEELQIFKPATPKYLQNKKVYSFKERIWN
jgi:hypothetical protein